MSQTRHRNPQYPPQKTGLVGHAPSNATPILTRLGTTKPKLRGPPHRLKGPMQVRPSLPSSPAHAINVPTNKWEGQHPGRLRAFGGRQGDTAAGSVYLLFSLLLLTILLGAVIVGSGVIAIASADDVLVVIIAGSADDVFFLLLLML